MNKEDIVRMAREAGVYSGANEMVFAASLERFAALVEAHVNAKEKERQRYDIHSCGPDCDRYICVAVRNEREACAKVCDYMGTTQGKYLASAIRARGNT